MRKYSSAIGRLTEDRYRREHLSMIILIFSFYQPTLESILLRFIYFCLHNYHFLTLSSMLSIGRVDRHNGCRLLSVHVSYPPCFSSVYLLYNMLINRQRQGTRLFSHNNCGENTYATLVISFLDIYKEREWEGQSNSLEILPNEVEFRGNWGVDARHDRHRVRTVWSESI